MTHPTYKLHYFDLHGLGEQIRLLLSDNSIPFEDARVNYPDWKDLKPTIALGQLPCLLVDGKQLCQSGAIMRHLGRQHDLYGASEDDRMHIDMFYEAIKDLHSKYTTIIYREYDNKPEFVEKVLPEQLTMIEKLFKTRNDGNGFILGGDKVCWADYTLLEELYVLQKSHPPCLDAFPALKAYYGRMSGRPTIQPYMTSDNFTKKPINGNDKF